MMQSVEETIVVSEEQESQIERLLQKRAWLEGLERMIEKLGARAVGEVAQILAEGGPDAPNKAALFLISHHSSAVSEICEKSQESEGTGKSLFASASEMSKN